MMNNSMKAVGALALVAACVLATASVWGADARHEALARQIIADTGVKGGLVVHVGCGDGKLTAALCQNDGYLVYGLDADPANVERAREHIRSLGLYGRVSAEQWDSEYLPYTDNLVNLLVLEGAADVRMREVRRVLAPEGAAYVEIGDQWMTNTNPRPGEIDEWTHFLHDATNNAVAHDALVGPPKHLQWIGSPKWARSHDHLASVSAVVSANGRIFYIADEGPTATVALPTAWFLVGRDAFSGVTLWRRAVRPWEGHLRGFRSGPSEIPRRLVAVDETVYVTLGYGKPVTALDAATGTTLRTYKGTAGADEILYHEGVLYLTAGDAAAQLADAAKRRGITLPPPSKDVLAVKADTGALLWRKSDDDTRGLMPLTLAVADGRVFFQNTKAVVCLDARSGERIWRTERRANLKRPAWSAPTLVVYEDVVLSAERGEGTRVGGETLGSGDVGWLVSSSGGDAPVGDLIAFSAETGRELWRCEAREAYNAPPDVLVAGGLVWTGILVRATEPGITVGRDPRTGEIKRERPPDKEFFVVGMGHHRCHRNKATDRYLVLGRAGVEFVELESGEGTADHWTRGTCAYGVMPCNGLLYAPSHSCACYIQAKLNGFNALAARRESPPPQADEPRLERGPAFGRKAPSTPAGSSDWPTYRGDMARSGLARAAVSPTLRRAWSTDIGGKLSSVVMAEGKVLVAQVDAHAVHALDGATGERIWSYTAGGRVDSPPTIHKGLALFGCADGWVYCLRASDGQLGWRFRAAPEERRIVAYEQVESAWPVHGSVLVIDDVAHFVAGRSAFVDGGMYLYRLEAQTGRQLSETHIDMRDPKTGEEPQELVRGTHMKGALPDVLASDGTSIFMRHVRFDRNGVEQEQNVPHLYSPAGFLDDAWWHRTYWIVGTSTASGWGGWPRVGNIVQSGRLLVVDSAAVYGFGRSKYATSGAHVGLGDVRYRLYAAEKELERVKPKPRPAGTRRRQPRPTTKVAYRWMQEVSLIARTMILAGDTLFLAGPPDLPDRPDDGLAAIYGGKGGVLWAVSARDGTKVAEYALDEPPVFDGMAAANGRLYLATTDGKVACFAAR